LFCEDILRTKGVQTAVRVKSDCVKAISLIELAQ